LDILHLKYLKPVSVDDHADRYVIAAAPHNLVHPDCCSEPDRIKHGTRTIVIHDLPVHGKRVELHIERQRIRRKKCGKTTPDPIPEINEKRLATNRLIRYIEQQSFARTFVSVSKK